MSQKKMEAYKYAKKHKKEIEQKKKKKRILCWIGGLLAAAVIVAGCGYVIYYTEVVVPEQQAAELTNQINADQGATDVGDSIVNFLEESGVDADVEITPTDDASTEEAAE